MSATPLTAAALPAALTLDNSRAAIDAVWSMTAHERVEAMWAGRLTLSQLCVWSSRRPSEVPRLGGEFAWIAIRTPEWADAVDLHPGTVIHLPQRRQHRAAA